VIFGQWKPGNGSEELVRAVDAIIAEAQMRSLARTPWSLAELEPDEDDYDWLCRWADGLEYKTVRSWISSLTPYKANEWSMTRQAAFGLIFLFFTSEVARRDASEGHLWKFVCKVSGKTPRFDDDVEALLFVQGQPTQALKQAVEQAAYAFNLRNVFGISGLMNWFDTVFLQFGFTRRGFLERLPFWLAGHATTQAITWLLSGQRHSPTFAALWHNLQELRRKNIRPDQFLLRAKDSPWLLPDWYADALAQAMRRPDLGTSGGSAALLPLGAEKPFLAVPTLLWQNTPAPVFVTHFQNLADQPLDEPHYTLVIAGRECATLVRQEDATYASMPTDTIILPLIAPSVAASLIRPDGEPVQTQSLALYEPADEVTAFRPDGARVADAWTTPISPAADLILLLSSDLTLTPPPARSALLADGTGRFHHLLRGWTPDTCVRLADEEFWKPVVARGPTLAEPEWATGVHIQWRRSAPEAAGTLAVAGPVAWLTVNHPDAVQVDWVRTGGIRLTRFVNPTSGRVAFGPAPLYDGHVERKVWLRLVREEDDGPQACVVCRTLDTRRAGGEGAMRQTPDGWVPMGEGTRLSVWEARTTPVRLVTPFAWGGFGPDSEFGLIEGEAWIGNAGRMARPLGRLGGWGASLELRPRPYNSVEEGIVLAAEVYDTGDLATALLLPKEGAIPAVQIRLHEPKEPDRYFQILWWDLGGDLFTIPGENISVLADGSWRCDVPGEASEPLVIGISYEGTRRGAWWRDDWADRIGDVGKNAPARCASLLRYFKLPLCAPGHVVQVQALLRAAPGEVLGAWFGNEGLPDGFRQEEDLNWDPTLRTLISDLSPDLTTAKGLVRLLGSQGVTFEDRLLLAVDRLTAVCPLLAARFMRVYREELLDHQVRAGQRTQAEVRRILQHVCCRLLDLPPTAGDPEIIRRKEALVDATAEVLGLGIVNAVNSAFVSSRAGGLVQKAVDLFEGRPLPSVHRDNLAVAFATVDPLRRLVAATLVQRLTN